VTFEEDLGLLDFVCRVALGLRTVNRGTIKRGQLIAGQLIAWTHNRSDN